MRKKPTPSEIYKMAVSDVFFIKKMSDIDAVGDTTTTWNPRRAMYFAMREDGALLCAVFNTGSDSFKPQPANGNIVKFKTGFRYPGGIPRKVHMVKTPAGVEMKSTSPRNYRREKITDETVVLTSFEVRLIKARRDKYRQELYASRRAARALKKEQERKQEKIKNQGEENE